MTINTDQIRKAANLSSLALEEESIEHLSNDIQNILDLLDHIQEANVDALEPMSHPLDITQRLRADQVTETNNRDQLQACAHETRHGLYLVPRVIV
ncbi:MAG: Asp-tRNA(Asn)/Glu-tRNA(Gln) amidotransferase subunit GatC [bacterium]